MGKVTQWVPTPAPILGHNPDKSLIEWIENGYTNNFWQLVAKEHDSAIKDRFYEIIEECIENQMEERDIRCLFGEAMDEVINSENEAAWERHQESLIEDGGSHHDFSHKLNQARKLK